MNVDLEVAAALFDAFVVVVVDADADVQERFRSRRCAQKNVLVVVRDQNFFAGFEVDNEAKGIAT